MKVRDLFDQCATIYDQDRPKLVPSFYELYGTAMRVIPFSSEARISVLDLGAGTGLFGAMIAQAFLAAHLHLTDISEADGPIQKSWNNFSPLGNEKYHCHLNYRYVACWNYRQGEKEIEVYYVGSREKAPY
jgi:hypothetical protein